MGDSVAEGTVLEWRVKVGDAVAVDDPLVEISTDKVDAEVPSPVAGTIAEILVEADQTVAVGSVLCRIAPGADGSNGSVQPKAEATEVKPAVEATATNGGNATPVAARIASAHGVDVDGSRAPARAAGSPRKTCSRPSRATGASRRGAAVEPIRGPAATLVKFMNDSRSIPTATSFRTLPVDTLDARRKALKAAGKKLSFTHLIAWAIVQAARDMPVMGHAYAEQDGKPQRVTPATVSLGLAVDVERKDGTRSLVVPVLRDASELGFADFVARYDELVAGARDNTLQPDAYQGANITLTNPGGIGTVASVPRLMPGQGTIVATGAIGYPPGLTAADPAKLAGARRPEGHDDDLDLRPPRDPGRRVGRVPAQHRPAAPGRERLLRLRLRAHWAWPRPPRRRPVTAAEPVPAAGGRPPRRRRPTPRCSRRCRRRPHS